MEVGVVGEARNSLECPGRGSCCRRRRNEASAGEAEAKRDGVTAAQVVFFQAVELLVVDVGQGAAGRRDR